MNLEYYPYQMSNSLLAYQFESDGPKGIIKKVIRYTPQNSGGTTYFNLGFGDLDEASERMDDLVKSNNMDREKILATIADSVLDFTAHFPDALVYARGSTVARTRLYQMQLSANWDEIELILYVYGYFNDGWYPFEKGVNYEAFLVSRKKLITLH